MSSCAAHRSGDTFDRQGLRVAMIGRLNTSTRPSNKGHHHDHLAGFVEPGRRGDRCRAQRPGRREPAGRRRLGCRGVRRTATARWCGGLGRGDRPGIPDRPVQRLLPPGGRVAGHRRSAPRGARPGLVARARRADPRLPGRPGGDAVAGRRAHRRGSRRVRSRRCRELVAGDRRMGPHQRQGDRRAAQAVPADTVGPRPAPTSRSRRDIATCPTRGAAGPPVRRRELRRRRRSDPVRRQRTARRPAARRRGQRGLRLAADHARSPVRLPGTRGRRRRADHGPGASVRGCRRNVAPERSGASHRGRGGRGERRGARVRRTHPGPAGGARRRRGTDPVRRDDRPDTGCRPGCSPISTTSSGTHRRSRSTSR